jgi:hypothetical protein
MFEPRQRGVSLARDLSALAGGNRTALVKRALEESVSPVIKRRMKLLSA